MRRFLVSSGQGVTPGGNVSLSGRAIAMTEAISAKIAATANISIFPCPKFFRSDLSQAPTIYLYPNEESDDIHNMSYNEHFFVRTAARSLRLDMTEISVSSRATAPPLGKSCNDGATL